VASSRPSGWQLAEGKSQRQLLLREGVPMRGERVDLGQARLPPEF